MDDELQSALAELVKKINEQGDVAVEYLPTVLRECLGFGILLNGFGTLAGLLLMGIGVISCMKMWPRLKKDGMGEVICLFATVPAFGACITIGCLFACVQAKFYPHWYIVDKFL